MTKCSAPHTSEVNSRISETNISETMGRYGDMEEVSDIWRCKVMNGHISNSIL